MGVSTRLGLSEIYQIEVMTMARQEAMAIVVTRCLSPLGTGNDETGSDGRGEDDEVCSVELPVDHCCPPLWKSVCRRSNTSFDGRLNIPAGKFPPSVSSDMDGDRGPGT